MKKLFMICFISLSVILGSCKKTLDTKPLDFLSPETFFTKPEDATAALNAAWKTLTGTNMYNGTYQYRGLTTDDCLTNLSAAFVSNLGVDATFSLFSGRWNSMYQAIQYVNVLLVNLPRVPMDEKQKGIIRGEALFLRGFLYYELVKEWGSVPMRLVPTAGPNDINIAATPAKDIYTQVIKDLTEAEGLVPTTATNGYGAAGYAAKTTVEAMLARVCLSMAGAPINDVTKYQDAKNWAQKVVDSHEHSLNPDFTQVFKNYASGVIDKKESLWEIDFNYGPGTLATPGQIGYLDGIKNSTISFGVVAGQYTCTRKLYLSYGAVTPTNSTTKDMRRDWTCTPFKWHLVANVENSDADIEGNKVYFTNTQMYRRYFAKFRMYYCPLPFTSSGAVSPINWPVMRYSDVLLMLAEAENYLNGPTGLAYSCINQVRERAWGKMLPGATNITEADEPVGMSKDAFQTELQNERYRELAGEALRKQDLIRWGIFVPTIKGLLADFNSTTFPVESDTKNTTTSGFPYSVVTQFFNKVSDRDLLWAIPASELQYNKLLKQNPGW